MFDFCKCLQSNITVVLGTQTPEGVAGQGATRGNHATVQSTTMATVSLFTPCWLCDTSLVMQGADA